ncbi:hypothetical protein SAMN03159437_02621 [Pseudomonas sp. NFACC25]|uniref:hypothetical protein n=1 Tax=Pseudomonas sp. NFACC25 TaxID=1566188 RepID=UPI000876271C|nr:hypothetical protein [Pseudomonas sp. NFACC25]SCX25037.1 hypothetical protein SAMN03159437_02621 [Pseudomonas sp. NFACC25]
MLRRKTFAQACAFLAAFWLVGEVFFGFVRSPFADTFTGNVYVAAQKNGFVQLEPLNAQVRVEIIDKGFVYDRVDEVSKSGLRIKFTGEGIETLKRYGVDPKLLGGEDPHGGLCEVRTSDTRNHANLFAGMKTDYSEQEMRYITAHDMKFYKVASDDVDCKMIHVGTVRFDNVQIAFDGLSSPGFVFADLKRDSHIGFLQRMIMKLRFNAEKDWPKFLAIN